MKTPISHWRGCIDKERSSGKNEFFPSSVPQGKQKTQDKTFAKLICKMLQWEVGFSKIEKSRWCRKSCKNGGFTKKGGF